MKTILVKSHATSDPAMRQWVINKNIDDYLSAAQFAAELGVTREAIYMRIARGQIDSIKLSGIIRLIPKSELSKWKLGSHGKNKRLIKHVL